MDQSLLAKGVTRKIGPPNPDLETCKMHKPDDVCRLGVAAAEFDLRVEVLFMSGQWPDWLVSGYRTNRETTPHAWGDAFDVKVGTIRRQIEFVRRTVVQNQYFKRGGLYVRERYKDPHGREYIGLRNTCHIDNRDERWMAKYRGTKFWVYDLGDYTGFWDIESAAQYALHQAQKMGEPL